MQNLQNRMSKSLNYIKSFSRKYVKLSSFVGIVSEMEKYSFCRNDVTDVVATDGRVPVPGVGVVVSRVIVLHFLQCTKSILFYWVSNRYIHHSLLSLSKFFHQDHQNGDVCVECGQTQ